MADVVVEVDKERVFREVVDRLVQAFYGDCKIYVHDVIKAQFTAAMRALAKKHFAEIFETLTFADGKTFRQYLEDLMTKPHGRSFPQRPRLGELLDHFVYNHATQLFHEIIEPHLADVKKRLIEAAVSMRS